MNTNQPTPTIEAKKKLEECADSIAKAFMGDQNWAAFPISKYGFAEHQFKELKQLVSSNPELLAAFNAAAKVEELLRKEAMPMPPPMVKEPLTSPERQDRVGALENKLRGQECGLRVIGFRNCAYELQKELTATKAELERVGRELDKADVPIGNEHETYTLSNRVEILGTVKNVFRGQVYTLRKDNESLTIERDEAQQWIDSEPDWKDKYMANYKKLIDELTQLRRDKERLDFLQTKVHQHCAYPPYNCNINFDWTNGADWLTDLREAIDDAISSTAKKEGE
jgi:hypothetical protein